MSEDQVIHIAIEEPGAERAGDADVASPVGRDGGADREAELKDRWLRAEAEIKNVRKRAAEDIRAARRAERESVLRALLPVADNLGRALDAEGERDDGWVEGVRAVHEQLSATLRELGVEPFGARDEMFDPRRHEAVAALCIPHTPDGTILDVLRLGYQMKGGVILRPAQVAVARTPEN